MSDVIDDETQWFPQAQTSYKNGASIRQDDGDDSDDDSVIFSLASGDMAALNRYLHGGRVLPLDRDSYCAQCQIDDTSIITDPVWKEIDKVIESFKDINSDCVGFLTTSDDGAGQGSRCRNKPTTNGGGGGSDGDDDDDGFDQLCTWDKMTTLSQNIYEYSENAGGEDSGDSYYGMMLRECATYHQTDDPKTKKQAKEYILEITEECLNDVTTIQTHISKVKKALDDFDNSCQKNEAALQTLEQSMGTTLTTEYGDMTDLQAKINTLKGQIADDQSVIDKDRLNQATVAAYVWIPVAGTIAGTVMWFQYQNDINSYQDKINDLNEEIQTDEQKIKVHVHLYGIVETMKRNTKSISDLIGPAKQTIEKIEGGWDVMGTMIQYIYDQASKFEDNIPDVLLSELQLDNIAKEWLKLNHYVESYIQQAHESPDLQITTVEEYKEELAAGPT